MSRIGQQISNRAKYMHRSVLYIKSVKRKGERKKIRYAVGIGETTYLFFCPLGSLAVPIL
jgi:hypothetical protein